MGDRTLRAQQYKEKHVIRRRRYIYSDYKRTKVLYPSTTDMYKDYRKIKTKKNKPRLGPQLHHKRRGSEARHRLFMEKAGNQTIQQLSKGNAQQPKKLMLGEEEKRENAMDTGRNGRNQLQINVRKRERKISYYSDTIMR